MKRQNKSSHLWILGEWKQAVLPSSEVIAISASRENNWMWVSATRLLRGPWMWYVEGRLRCWGTSPWGRRKAGAGASEQASRQRRSCKQAVYGSSDMSQGRLHAEQDFLIKRDLQNFYFIIRLKLSGGACRPGRSVTRGILEFVLRFVCLCLPRWWVGLLLQYCWIKRGYLLKSFFSDFMFMK